MFKTHFYTQLKQIALPLEVMFFPGKGYWNAVIHVLCFYYSVTYVSKELAGAK